MEKYMGFNREDLLREITELFPISQCPKQALLIECLSDEDKIITILEESFCPYSKIRKYIEEKYKKIKSSRKTKITWLSAKTDGTSVRRLRKKVLKSIYNQTELWPYVFIDALQRGLILTYDPPQKTHKKWIEFFKSEIKSAEYIKELNKRYEDIFGELPKEAYLVDSIQKLSREESPKALVEAGELKKPQKDAVINFLEDIEIHIEDELNYLSFFTHHQKINIEKQYIPIQVIDETNYQHDNKPSIGSEESIQDLEQAYVFKNAADEFKPNLIPWNLAKNQGNRIVILGDPGIGKSTLLLIEALRLVRNEINKLMEPYAHIDDAIFPLFLNLSEIDKQDKEIMDAILELINRNYPKSSAGLNLFLNDKVSSGKFLLLLDSLDEVPIERRHQLSMKLNRFTRNIPCKIICTSRMNGYMQGFLRGAIEFEIAPFGPDQIRQCATNWYTNTGLSITNCDVSLDQFIKELLNKPHVEGLSRNPLHLSFLYKLSQNPQNTFYLPFKRSQIYKNLFIFLLEEWGQNRKPKSEWNIISIKKLIGELAYHLYVKEKRDLSSVELHDWIEDKIKNKNMLSDFINCNASEILSELAEHSGIIRKSRDGEPTYLFVHQTFLEYFTAFHLKGLIETNQDKGLSIIRSHLWEYNLHETIILLAGLIENAIPLILAILEEKDDIFQSLLMLAGRCISECQNVSHRSINKAVSKICKYWKLHPDLQYIQVTMISLGKANFDIFDTLSKAFHGNKLSDYAGKLLVDIGTRQAVNVLINSISSKSAITNLSARNALIAIGNNEAINALVRALDDNNKDVRINAVRALGGIGGKQVGNILLKALEEDADLKAPIISVFGEHYFAEAIETLIDLLDDDDPDIREAAATSLGLGFVAKAKEKLEYTLKHDIDYVRASAKIALRNINFNEKIEYYKQGFDDIRTCIELDHLIEGFRIKNVVGNILLYLAKSDITYVRRQAVLTLGEFNNRQAINSLEDALDDKEKDIRISAITALGNIGTDRTIMPLKKALKDKDQTVKYYAAKTLAEINSPEAIKLFIRSLKKKDISERRIASKVLGMTGSEKAVKPLILSLKDKEIDVRRNAAISLGDIGSEKGVYALFEKLPSVDRYFKHAIVQSLASIGTLNILEKIVRSPEINICDTDIFNLVRKLAIRHMKKKTPFLPLYPELVQKFRKK